MQPVTEVHELFRRQRARSAYRHCVPNKEDGLESGNLLDWDRVADG
jgi:hypothetical protein